MNLMVKPRAERCSLLLQHLPRGLSNAQTLAQLMQVFNPTGEQSNHRTKLLQQDIKTLHSVLGENSTIRRVPDWSEDNPARSTVKYYLDVDLDVSTLTGQTQLFWKLLEHFTAHYLPPVLSNIIAQKSAEVTPKPGEMITKGRVHNCSGPISWTNCMVTLETTKPGPDIDLNIIGDIYRAIKDYRAIIVTYRNFVTSDTEATLKTYKVYPSGFLFINNTMRLLAIKTNVPWYDYDIVGQATQLKQEFAVQHIVSVEVLDEPFERWVDNLGMVLLVAFNGWTIHSNVSKDKILLILDVTHEIAEQLYTQPLCDEQTIMHGSYGTQYRVTAHLKPTVQLEEWLILQALNVKIIGPAVMRTHVIKQLQQRLDSFT